MPSFYSYFKENMEALNPPAPDALFGQLGLAVGTATTILTAIDKFGKAVTLGELIGAGTKLEGLALISGLSASFYAGVYPGIFTPQSATRSSLRYMAARYA